MPNYQYHKEGTEYATSVENKQMIIDREKTKAIVNCRACGFEKHFLGKCPCPWNQPTWEDIQRGVAFDVVGLYAAASAIAVGLSFTGGGLWLAREAIDFLPPYFSEGNGLIMGVRGSE